MVIPLPWCSSVEMMRGIDARITPAISSPETMVAVGDHRRVFLKQRGEGCAAALNLGGCGYPICQSGCCICVSKMRCTWIAAGIFVCTLLFRSCTFSHMQSLQTACHWQGIGALASMSPECSKKSHPHRSPSAPVEIAWIAGEAGRIEIVQAWSHHGILKRGPTICRTPVPNRELRFVFGM